MTRNHDHAWPNLSQLSITFFSTCSPETSEIRNNARLKKKRVYFNLHFIAVVSQPCMLQRIYFNIPLHSIVVSLLNRRNFLALSSAEKRARLVLCARLVLRARLVLCARLVIRARLVLRARLQNAIITPVLQPICGQLRFHDNLVLVPLVIVRDSNKEQCYVHIFYCSWSRSMWSAVLWPRNTCSEGLNGVVAGWLQLTVNILAFLLLMVNFKLLTIFSIVVKHVLPV